jgi:hypothetical protein
MHTAECVTSFRKRTRAYQPLESESEDSWEKEITLQPFSPGGSHSGGATPILSNSISESYDSRAQAACENRGQFLPEITNQEEKLEVATLMKGSLLPYVFAGVQDDFRDHTK